MAETIEVRIETRKLGQIRVQFVAGHLAYRVSIDGGEWGPWKEAELGEIDYDEWRAAMIAVHPGFGKQP